MARSRNLKPSIFKNEILGTADPLYTILFECLWCLADREGRLEDRPMRIKVEAFPYRDNIDMDAMLSWLSDHKFIIRYSIGEEKYIQIINFRKHQNPHVKEHASTIPAPGSNGTSIGYSGTGPADSLNPLTDSLNPITTKAADAAYSDEFERIWALYPKRSGDNPKKAAYQHFKARLKTDSIQNLEAGVIRYAHYCEATEKTGTEYVMQAKRFFGNTKPFLNDWKVNHTKPVAKLGKIHRAVDAMEKFNGTSTNSATANNRATGTRENAGPPARLRTDRR